MAAISIVGVGLAVALVVGGCNGDGEGSTTEPATTTVPATTVAPTTTIDPVAAEEAAVSEAAEQARLVATEALINPDDAAAIAALDQYYVAESVARQTIDDALNDFHAEGLRVRTNPEIAESVTVEQVSFDATPPREAELVVCVVDPSVVYEPNAAPDGSDVIVNDIVYSHRLIYRMQKVDGSWRLFSVSDVESWEGITACPAAS